MRKTKSFLGQLVPKMMALIDSNEEDRAGRREPGTGGRDLLPGLSGRETLEEIRGAGAVASSAQIMVVNWAPCL